MDEITIKTVEKQLPERILRADEFFEITSQTVTLYSFKPFLSKHAYHEAGVSIIDQSSRNLLIHVHGSKFDKKNRTSKIFKAGVIISDRKGALIAIRVPVAFPSIEVAWAWLDFGISSDDFIDFTAHGKSKKV